MLLDGLCLLNNLICFFVVFNIEEVIGLTKNNIIHPRKRGKSQYKENF